MNYSTTRDDNESADVRFRTNKTGGMGVPLPPPFAMANVPRVTKDSSPEKETAQNQFHESDGNVDDDPNNNVTLETNAPNNQTTTYTSSEYARAPLSTGASMKESSQSNWNVGADWHRSVPSFYPLEK